MSDLNVDVKRTLGEYLPTAFIREINILDDLDDPVTYSEMDIAIDINLTIDKDITSYRDVISTNLDDLYLYVVCSKSQTLNQNLLDNKLDLREIFSFNGRLSAEPAILVGRGIISGDPDFPSTAGVSDEEIMQTLKMNIWKTNLRDLKNRMIEEDLYDIHGDKILKISNLKFKTRFVRPLMNGIPNAVVMAFVGRDNAAIQSLNEIVHKRNFGDISREIVLEKGAVPDLTEEIYVDILDNQYNGIPIQSIGGKYHLPEPVSQAEIVDLMNNLMTAYSATGQTSEDLTSAFNNLAYILSTREAEEDMILKLNLYRKAYPDKSSATVAGGFYDLFKKKLYFWNRKVLAQPRLYKRLILNTKISDLRGSDLYEYEVVPPDPDPLDLDYDSDYFINLHTFNINRTTVLTTPLEGLVSDFVEFVAEEGISNSTTAAALWSKTYDVQFAASLDDQLSSDFDVDDPGAGGVPGVLQSQQLADTVVKNKGLFFFDWERALHTKSDLAKVFRLHLLQSFLGIHVPYDLFQVKNVYLRRSERKFETQNESADDWAPPPDETFGYGSGSENSYAKIEFYAWFYPDSGFPNQGASEWTGEATGGTADLVYGFPYVYKFGSPGATEPEGSWDFTGYEWAAAHPELTVSAIDPITGEATATATINEYMNYAGLQIPRWATEWVASANEFTSKHRATSYLKFKDFDLPRDKAYRLDGYQGSKIAGGYRLMCFEFQDFMDDDVAYYNTIGSHFGDRERYWTEYTIEINVEDKTLQLWDYILGILEAEYNGFIENYYNKAIAMCSYNNIDDVFNEFFISAMEDAEASAYTAWWYRAPYIYNVFMHIVTNKYSGLLNIKERIIEDSAIISSRIGPRAGRLSELENFKTKFENLLSKFRSLITDTGVESGEVWELYTAAGVAPAMTHTFYRAKSITESIFGNLYLSAWLSDDIEVTDLWDIPDPSDDPTISRALEAELEAGRRKEEEAGQGIDLVLWHHGGHYRDRFKVAAISDTYSHTRGDIVATFTGVGVGAEYGRTVYLEPGSYEIQFDGSDDARDPLITWIDVEVDPSRRDRWYGPDGELHTAPCTLSYRWEESGLGACGDDDDYIWAWRFTNNHPGGHGGDSGNFLYIYRDAYGGVSDGTTFGMPFSNDMSDPDFSDTVCWDMYTMGIWHQAYSYVES